MYQTQINIIRIDNKDLKRMQGGKAIHIELTNGQGIQLQWEVGKSVNLHRLGEKSKKILTFIKPNIDLATIKKSMDGQWEKNKKQFYNLVMNGTISAHGPHGKKQYNIAHE